MPVLALIVALLLAAFVFWLVAHVSVLLGVVAAILVLLVVLWGGSTRRY